MVWSKTKMRADALFGVGALIGLAAVGILRTSRYELAGKTVFISGGSRGLGLLLAQEFAARGAKIAISARDRDALERAADGLRRQAQRSLPWKPISASGKMQ